MIRCLVTSLMLCAVVVAAPAAASPRAQSPFADSNPSACGWLEGVGRDANSLALTDAFDAMGDLCHNTNTHDEGMMAHAIHALSDWVDALGTTQAADCQARFFRALAALEAQADLFAAESNTPGFSDPALMLEPFSGPAPETAIFILEEASVPFLGPTQGAGATVMIAVDAPGYEDLFTIHFPRGSAHLTLAAEDMIALAAIAARDYSSAEIWVAASPALSAALAFDRMSVVQDILLQNDVPGQWIHFDDGGIDAIMNRPTSLLGDTEA